MEKIVRLLILCIAWAIMVYAMSITMEAATPRGRDVRSGYPYSSIQAAINDAVDGDEVLVHNGTYMENVKSRIIHGIVDMGAYEYTEEITFYDVTGTWNFSLTNNWVNPGSAGCTPGADETDTAVLTQTGNNVTAVTDGITYTGSVSGSTYTFSAPPYAYQGGTITVTNPTFAIRGILVS